MYSKDRKAGYTETYLGKVGELTLKGSNMKLFEKQLCINLKTALDSVETQVFLKTGRLMSTVLFLPVRPLNLPLIILLELPAGQRFLPLKRTSRP